MKVKKAKTTAVIESGTYEEQSAVNRENKPLGDDIHMWMEVTRSHMIGRNSVLDPILKWMEAHGEAVIKKKKIAKVRDDGGLMTDPEPAIAITRVSGPL